MRPINREFSNNASILPKAKRCHTPQANARLQKIARTTEKLQEILHGRDFDIEWEIDRMHGHPQTRMPLSHERILEEILSSQELIALMAVFGPMATPCTTDGEISEQTGRKRSSKDQRKACNLVDVAESGISCNQERKDSKRKNDVLRYFLILELARHYEETFKRKAIYSQGRRMARFLIKSSKHP